MDIVDGLQLLAENSWGATRKILYEARNEILANEETILTADHLASCLENPKEAYSKDQIGQVRASAMAIRSRRETRDHG